MLPQKGKVFFPYGYRRQNSHTARKRCGLMKRIRLLQQAGNHAGHAVGLLQHGDAGLHQHLLFRHV